ncbi:MAG: DNA polymerase III subunit beta [Tannerellaceae bacterium]|jgi:DNA polymerase-3 subunit beta|nr:DNA polymerase III subunit beta [Tannerellaceae bacterium]
MTITVPRSEFLSRLQTAGKIISAKPVLPIMAYFLCEVREGRLNISAADSIGRIDTFMECVSDAEGKICIESRKIIEALKELPEQPIRLEINEENYEIRIVYSGGRFEMVGSNPLLFPEAKKISDTVSFDVESELFIKGINGALFCAADDELRPAMNGVFIETDDTGINFVATDSHRMALIHCDASALPRQSFVLPVKVAGILKGFYKKTDETVSIHAGTSNVKFNIGGYRITSILQEGRFPNYRSVIPKNEKRLTIDTSSLKDAISRVSLFANQATLLVVLSLTKNNILVKAQDIDYSSHAQETIACEYEDEKFEIGLKSSFMQEILSHIESDQVVLLFSEPQRAILIEPSGKGDNVMYLQMPLTIN